MEISISTRRAQKNQGDPKSLQAKARKKASPLSIIQEVKADPDLNLKEKARNLSIRDNQKKKNYNKKKKRRRKKKEMKSIIIKYTRKKKMKEPLQEIDLAKRKARSAKKKKIEVTKKAKRNQKEKMKHQARGKNNVKWVRKNLRQKKRTKKARESKVLENIVREKKETVMEDL